MMYWTVAALSLLGVWLNVRRHYGCFIIWSVTNAIWAVVDWMHGLHAQAVLMAIYCALAVYGLRRWSREGEGESRGEENPA